MIQVNVDSMPEDRVETGGVRFDDDWPGFFLRGDDALYVAALISSLSMKSDVPELEWLKIYADQIFDEVPYKQWIDEHGHSIIQATLESHISQGKLRVQRDGKITRVEDDDEEDDAEDER